MIIYNAKPQLSCEEWGERKRNKNDCQWLVKHWHGLLVVGWSIKHTQHTNVPAKKKNTNKQRRYRLMCVKHLCVCVAKSLESLLHFASYSFAIAFAFFSSDKHRERVEEREKGKVYFPSTDTRYHRAQNRISMMMLSRAVQCKCKCMCLWVE